MSFALLLEAPIRNGDSSSSVCLIEFHSLRENIQLFQLFSKLSDLGRSRCQGSYNCDVNTCCIHIIYIYRYIYIYSIYIYIIYI